MSCVIEEVDPAADPLRYADALERILIECGRDPAKFLGAVFAFLHAKSSFFAQPDASKVLARLLRDVKKGGVAAKGVSSGFFGGVTAEPAAKHATAASAAAPPPTPAQQINGSAQVPLQSFFVTVAKQAVEVEQVGWGCLSVVMHASHELHAAMHGI